MVVPLHYVISYCLGVWGSTYKRHLVIKDLKDNRSGGHLTFVWINTDDNTAIYYYYCMK